MLLGSWSLPLASCSRSKLFSAAPRRRSIFPPQCRESRMVGSPVPPARRSLCSRRNGAAVTAENGREESGSGGGDGGGMIHLILGPMFAGKTTALLQRVQAEAEAGRTVALVKSDKDTRYGLGCIVSHTGRKMHCAAVPSLSDFKSRKPDIYSQAEIIGIDEAQFFDDLLSFCQSAADFDNKTVIVAGLDGDFQRRRFGSALDLVPLADSVTKLSSRCEICNRPAAFTFRKTDDRRREVIGGADIYMPVCRKHYVNGQFAMEAARTVLEAQSSPPPPHELQTKLAIS